MTITNKTRADAIEALHCFRGECPPEYAAEINAAIDELNATPALEVVRPDVLETMRYAIGYQLGLQIAIDGGSSHWINKLREADTWLKQQRPTQEDNNE